MHELLPITGGALIGAVLALLMPPWRLPVGLALVSGLAIYATVMSGEWQVDPLFVVLDLLFVGLPAVAGFLAVRSWRRRRLN